MIGPKIKKLDKSNLEEETVVYKDFEQSHKKNLDIKSTQNPSAQKNQSF